MYGADAIHSGRITLDVVVLVLDQTGDYAGKVRRHHFCLRVALVSGRSYCCLAPAAEAMLKESCRT